MTKKINKICIYMLLIALCAVLFCGLFVINNFSSKKVFITHAEDSYVTLYDDWYYRLNYNIENLTITNDKEPANFIGEAVDVSKEGDGRLKAYQIDNGDATYDCIIYANVEKICVDSGVYLFSNDKLDNCKSITFDDCFDTSKVTSMQDMFSGCEILKTLDLSMFDVSNVESLVSTFSNCYSLESINFAGWNGSFSVCLNVFSNCSSLKKIDFSVCDNLSLGVLFNMFSDCSSLTELYLGASCSIGTGSFYGLEESLKILDLGDQVKCISLDNNLNIIETNVSIESLFSGLTALEKINVSGLNTSNVTSLSHMFDGCSSLTSLDLNSFDTSKVTDMCNMFDSCSALESLDISSFDTSNVTNMNSMFLHCSKLKAIDVSKFNTSKVTDFFAMFTGCSAVEVLDLSSFDFSSVTSDNNMLGFIGINDTMVLATLQSYGSQTAQLLTTYQQAVANDDDATRIAVVAKAVQNLFGQTEEESQLIAQGLFNTSIKTIYAPVSVNSRNISLPYNNNDIFVYKNGDTEVETAFLVGRGEAEELAIYPKNTTPLAKPETSTPSVTPETGFVDEQLLPAMFIGILIAVVVVAFASKRKKYNI